MAIYPCSLPVAFESMATVSIKSLNRVDGCTACSGPIVQSIIILTSSLPVKMLPDLESTISNSQVFLLKNVSSFCKCKSYSHFFSKNINSVYAIFNDQSFNDTLTYDIVSFEQMGPGLSLSYMTYLSLVFTFCW